MAVIHFTAADALQTKVVPAAIYPSEVVSITGPTRSSTGKSVNYVVDIAITEGEFKGKTRTVMFNSESNNISLLGDMQFFPQCYFLQLDSAISGRSVENTDYALDLDSLIHKPFDADWQTATVDGHLTNTIGNFYPKGYGKTGPAF